MEIKEISDSDLLLKILSEYRRENTNDEIYQQIILKLSKNIAKANSKTLANLPAEGDY